MKGLALLLPVLVALQVGVQPALAWAWPVDGPVLRPFVLGDDPYAGGQHRGIDIGAPPGAAVRAPVSGSVSFTGAVPTGGRTITIRTADGYAVTLQRLGSYSVLRGAEVAEGDVVASVGDAPEPYVYLGVRKADEPDGYVDPLPLLPAPAPTPIDPAPVEPDPVPAPVHGGANHYHHLPVPQPAPAEVPSATPERTAPSARPAHLSGPAGRAHADEPRRALRTRQARSPLTVRGSVPAAAGIGSPAAEEAHVRAGNAHDSGTRHLWPFSAVAAALGLAVLGARLARGKLGHAGATNGPPAVLLQRASTPAEDANGLRLREKDNVVLDRDLERVLLPERKALPDLDRNDDPAEVVDVADDPRFRCPPHRARPQRALTGSVRPQRISAFRLRRTSGNTSPRLAVSNHHFRPRSGAGSFV
jgi:peptidase M23-like protein